MKTSIKILSLLTAGALASTAAAKVSFALDIEALTDELGGSNYLTNSGLLVLVVDAGSDGFSLPSAGNLASGGDEVVATWDLASQGPGTSGITLLTQGGVDYSGTWSEGDPLALFWFPSLASGGVPATDEVYGMFTDGVGFTQGDSWAMPSDNTLLHSLKLFTESATQLVDIGNGDVPNLFGQAGFAVNGTAPIGGTAPTSVVVTPNGDVIELSWPDGNADGGSFIIQRSPAGQTDWETVGSAGASSTGFTDDLISAGLLYTYRVLAGNGFGVGATAAAAAVQAERSLLASVAARSLMQPELPRRMYGQVDVIGNAPTKNVIIQASGPWLAGKIIGDPVQDPAMELYTHPNPDFNDRVTIDLNIDDWMSQTNALAIDQAQSDFGSDVHTRRVNIFDISSKDASWLGEVNSGDAYTFAVNSVDGSTGPIHIGIYNVEAAGTQFDQSDNRIVALATRGYLGSAIGHKMFGEFTIEGNVKKLVLIRGLGPNLGYFPPLNDGSALRAVVEDPNITLYYHPDPINDISTRTEIAFNDDWETQVPSAAVITDMNTILEAEQYMLNFDPRQVPFDLGSKDALLLVELDPGVYTFILNAPGTGIGLLGIYEIEI